MRVLVVKTASMGGVFQTLPALTDAKKALPSIVFDWVVEESFSEVPSWHPAVESVIPVAFRRWRKHPLATLHTPEWRQFKTTLRRKHYDLVIDCQSMLKSAFISRMAKAPIAGVDKHSAKEPMATWLYRHRYSCDARQHQVEKVRELFAKALNYDIPTERGDYGIDVKRFMGSAVTEPNIVLLHSCTRTENLYPEEYWRELARSLALEGYQVKLPWGSDADQARARWIAKHLDNVEVMPRLNLHGVACLLVQANAVISVDSGLCQLSAALSVPTLSLYGNTNPEMEGAYGLNQYCLRAETETQPKGKSESIFETLTPQIVLAELKNKILDQQNHVHAEPLRKMV